MHIFKKFFEVAILLLLSGRVLGDSDLPERTPDGRYGTLCYIYSTLSDEEICEVPFSRLLVTPERYDGKIIRVSGYLINSYNYPVIFANKNSFDSGAEIEGVVLWDAKLSKEMEKKISSGVWPVYVIGRFYAKYDNDDKISRLGMIKEIIRVEKMPDRMTASPKVIRKGVGALNGVK